MNPTGSTQQGTRLHCKSQAPGSSGSSGIYCVQRFRVRICAPESFGIKHSIICWIVQRTWLQSVSHSRFPICTILSQGWPSWTLSPLSTLSLDLCGRLAGVTGDRPGERQDGGEETGTFQEEERLVCGKGENGQIRPCGEVVQAKRATMWGPAQPQTSLLCSATDQGT